ncbi:hypothetical protein LY90DRAFT_643056 [Neocallimastix californiae]|uniref:PLC-like phosphodiesterase n=1 Tax=Neocallimastix californiae TaxID=1754190 RepID=A0A1Y2DPA5_9FUNG|nr:hypothetical protein LY90DRAFT_643056 [Neocallimastix californiae]|eukprot:ORY61118.1 hypothetical protein LY90DRAFT_643056 [Neocallimastix californiae]
MTNINSNLTINQINIPGTHDSGTYDIRLETNDDKEIYISHGYIDSINEKNWGKILFDIFDECIMFLKNNDQEFIVLNLADENFDDDFSWDDVPDVVAKLSILNESTTIKSTKTNTDFHLDNTKPYKDYFYVTSNVNLNDVGDNSTYISKTTFPAIKNVQGKIVICTKKMVL